jgi:hypothetical protein
VVQKDDVHLCAGRIGRGADQAADPIRPVRDLQRPDEPHTPRQRELPLRETTLRLPFHVSFGSSVDESIFPGCARGSAILRFCAQAVMGAEHLPSATGAITVATVERIASSRTARPAECPASHVTIGPDSPSCPATGPGCGSPPCPSESRSGHRPSWLLAKNAYRPRTFWWARPNSAGAA